MRRMIVIKNIPMPPSVNKSYEPRYRGNKLFLVKSTELENYKRNFSLWWSIERYRYDLTGLKKTGPLSLDLYFEVPKSQLWTLKGTPKSWDTTNRRKALEDCISEAIGIDDKWFFGGYNEKFEGINYQAHAVLMSHSSQVHEIL